MLYRFGPQITIGPWECWTMLSALVEATSRIELGTMVLCNPFRNPDCWPKWPIPSTRSALDV
jgi:hypothetical protein